EERDGGPAPLRSEGRRARGPGGGPGRRAGRRPDRRADPSSIPRGAMSQGTVFKGIAACPGVAVGPLWVLDRGGAHPPRARIPESRVEEQVERVREAIARSREALSI